MRGQGPAMEKFGLTLLTGLRRAAWLRLVVPLYLTGLLLGLLQTWPVLGAGSAGPLLDGLAAGSGDALALLFIADPGAITPLALLWAAGALAAAAAYGLAYNLFSGGILGAWAGAPFWAGCRRFFLGFTAMGLLLLLMVALALIAAIVIGVAAGVGAALATALVLLQLIGLWGEYGRAAAVATGRANPLLALGAGARALARRPLAALALAALGLLLHLGVAAAYGAVGPRLSWWAPLAQQAAALAWVWVKLLRLGWASAVVEG
jgi:hypothetical protein